MNMLDNTFCWLEAAIFSSSPLSTPNLISSLMLIMICGLIERLEVGQENGASMRVTWCPGASHLLYPFFPAEALCESRPWGNRIGAHRTSERQKSWAAESNRRFYFLRTNELGQTCPIILPIWPVRVRSTIFDWAMRNTALFFGISVHIFP